MDAMDWHTFFALVTALAWPVTTIALATLFHGPIVELLSRVNKIRVPGAEIQLGLKAAKALADSEEGGATRSILDIASINPIAAIALASDSVERALIDVARRNSTLRAGDPATENPVYIARALNLKGKMGDVTYALFAILNQLRNAASHSMITTSEAIEFNDLANRFTSKLLSM